MANKTPAEEFDRPISFSSAMANKTPAEEFDRIFRLAFPDTVLTVINPGRCHAKVAKAFNSESFNAKGCVTTKAILYALDVIPGLRFFSKTGKQFLEIGKLGHLMFIATIKVSCEPELYDPHLVNPLELVHQLLSVGNTSMRDRASLYIPQVKKPVAHKEFTRVFIDQNTGKPVALPAWWKEKYAPFAQSQDDLLHTHRHVDFRKWTGSVQQVEICVNAIDLDPYGHCNHIGFVKFCCDAYGLSAFRQFRNSSRGNPFRNLKSLACTYKGQAGLGDLLTVCFIQDPVDSDAYHFEIVKGQEKEKPIFQCFLTFFPQQNLSKY